jgi:hypothetical protein
MSFLWSETMPTKSCAPISSETLRKYDGQWVAFSEDGSRIVACAKTLLELDQLIVAAGEDPETVGLERIEFDETLLGGGDVL